MTDLDAAPENLHDSNVSIKNLLEQIYALVEKMA